MIYILVWFFLSFLSFVSSLSNRINNSLKSSVAILLCFTFFILYIGTRDGVGTDFFSYRNVFYENSLGFKDFLFNIIIEFCKPFGYYYFIFFVGILTAVMWIGSFYKLSPLPYVSILILSSNLLIYFGFSGIRQGLALATVAYALTLRKRRDQYIIYTIAFFIHSSAIIAFFIPFLERIDELWNWLTRLLIKLRFTLISQRGGFIFLVSIIFISILAVYGLTSGLFSNADIYIAQQSIGQRDFDLLNGIIVRLFPLLFYLVSRALSSTNHLDNANYLSTKWFYICVSGLLIYIPLATLSSEVAVRLTAYLSQFDAILFAYSIALLSKPGSRVVALSVVSIYTLIMLCRYVQIPEYTYFSYLF